MVVADPAALIVAQVGIETINGTRLRIDISADWDSVCFQAVRLVGPIAYIGYGSRLFIVDVTARVCVAYQMDGYFGGFETPEDLEAPAERFSVLVRSAGDILAFDALGKLIWKSDKLGIDGVVLNRVCAGVLYGEGEWDPPGGWRPFALSLATGKAIV